MNPIIVFLLRWIAYSHVDFSGSQYILEKGFYNNCADWGSLDNRICSVQPILLVRTTEKIQTFIDSISVLLFKCLFLLFAFRLRVTDQQPGIRWGSFSCSVNTPECQGLWCTHISYSQRMSVYILYNDLTPQTFLHLYLLLFLRYCCILSQTSRGRLRWFTATRRLCQKSYSPSRAVCRGEGEELWTKFYSFH